MAAKTTEKMTSFIRKVLGITPAVGDPVAGHTDFGVEYMGILTEKTEWLCNVRGAYVIHTHWDGDIIETDNEVLVPLLRLKHA